MMFERIKENPFKEETRRYPVDYVIPRYRFYMLAMQLPEGASIESLPEATRFVLPDGAGSYTYQVQALGGTVQILSDLKLNKATFAVHEYDALRAFYDMMIKKQGEQIVIKLASE
ncbi:MAG: transglutaminase, partial [Bacteroidota bacterium]